MTILPPGEGEIQSVFPSLYDPFLATTQTLDDTSFKFRVLHIYYATLRRSSLGYISPKPETRRSCILSFLIKMCTFSQFRLSWRDGCCPEQSSRAQASSPVIPWIRPIDSTFFVATLQMGLYMLFPNVNYVR